MAIQTIVNGQIVVVGTTVGMDISNFVGEVRDTPGTVNVKDYATFGSGGFLLRAAGQKLGSFGLSGYYDASSGGIAETITPTMLGQTCGVSIAQPSSGFTYGEGAWATFGTGVLGSYKPALNPDDIGMIDLDFPASSGFATGVVGAPLTNRSSTFTGAGVAMTGPTATQKVWALLLVTLAAGTNLAVKVQSDDNGGFSSATDRITFSTVSAAGGPQLLSVAGNLATETFWRVTATIGTGNFTYQVLFGLATGV